MANDGVNTSTFTLGYKSFNSEFYGLNKKIRNAQKSGFKIKEIMKLTMKIASNLSNQKICYSLNMSIPRLHLEFFRLLYQDSNSITYNNTFLNDQNHPVLHTYRRWILFIKKNI